MNFARPATGFIMTEPATFKELLQGHAGKWPRVISHWEGVKDRLKMLAPDMEGKTRRRVGCGD
jgi:hypothetical protein